MGRRQPGRTLGTMPVNVWSVTAAAVDRGRSPPGLGALPFVFVRDMSRRWLGISNGLAAAVMIVAAGGLVWQGVGIGPWHVALGLAGGGAFVWVFRMLIGEPRRPRDRRARRLGCDEGPRHRRGHDRAFGRGGRRASASPTAAANASASSSRSRSRRTTCPRASRSASSSSRAARRVRTAAWWSVFSCLPQPLIAPFTYLFVEWFKPALPAGLGFAAGAMVWIVWSELLPEMRGAAATAHALV